MCLFSCFILFSFVLADIWQKLKFIPISLIRYVSSFFLPYLFLLLVLMLHINILLSFHSRHVFESIIFNIEDNVWFRFGGDIYRFLSFCFILFSCVKKKKSFAKLEVYVLSSLYYSCLKNFIAFILNSLHMHVATQTQLIVEG